MEGERVEDGGYECGRVRGWGGERVENGGWEGERVEGTISISTNSRVYLPLQ